MDNGGHFGCRDGVYHSLGLQSPGRCGRTVTSVRPVKSVNIGGVALAQGLACYFSQLARAPFSMISRFLCPLSSPSLSIFHLVFFIWCCPVRGAY
jgi:hypothetical protein